MRTLTIRISFVAFLLVVAALTTKGANDNPPQKHLSGLAARVTLANGGTEIVRINGIGCTESMCSTVLTKAKTESNEVVEIWFDSISAIRDIHQNDAVFVAKSGSERRLAFISDFRVLYVSKSGGTKEKIDLARIKGLEIIGAGR